MIVHTHTGHNATSGDGFTSVSTAHESRGRRLCGATRVRRDQKCQRRANAEA